MNHQGCISPSRPDAMPAPAADPAAAMARSRPQVAGKFLVVDGAKLYVRGVTYGTFRPDAAGDHLLDPEVAERDFDQMAASA
jgi:hypothetical protein